MKKTRILSLLLACLFLLASFSFSAAEENDPEDMIEEAAETIEEGDPEDQPKETEEEADYSDLTAGSTERVNFLICGIDHKSHGKVTTSGTQVHSDVCIVVSVDFTNKKVDLITVPRDTLVTVPGIKGFYKLNCSFNVGGGMNDTDSGFKTVAATVSELLGGISIPYYLAVDLDSIVALADAIGGVDFDLEMSFRGPSRYYKAGFQHLDGIGVRDYVRARKSATVGMNKDTYRTARQRKMLIALYKKVKEEGIILKLPGIIDSVKTGIWTNLSLTQMATLANFALHFSPDDVVTHTLAGKVQIRHTWGFHWINQAKRIQLIKEIFGIEAEPYGVNSHTYEDYLHELGFKARKAIAQAEKAFTAAQKQVEGGKKLSKKQESMYQAAYIAYEDLVNISSEVDQFLYKHYDGIPKKDRKEKDRLYAALRDAIGNVKKTVNAFAPSVGIKREKLSWAVKNFVKDKDINEVPIDWN